mgnify:CR=1 FL=1
MTRFKASILAFLVLSFLGCGGEAAPGQSEMSGSEAAPASPQATESSTSGSANRIEFQVTGQLEASGAENDIMLCSTTEGSEWAAQSMGDWVIGFEFRTLERGEHVVELLVAAPTGVIQHEAVNRDPRFRGTGQATLEEAGTDAFGMSVVEVEFTASGLVNEHDQTINVEGQFVCPVL